MHRESMYGCLRKRSFSPEVSDQAQAKLRERFPGLRCEDPQDGRQTPHNSVQAQLLGALRLHL